MSWLGIDVGKKRTGVALSDSGILTTPIGILTGSSSSQINQLLEIAQKYQVYTIVIGEPRIDTDHPAGQFYTNLKAQIEHKNLKIELVKTNEELTTKEAERLLGEARRSKLDSDVVAAQLILEQYLAQSKEDTSAK